MKNIITNLINEGRLTEDSWVIWGDNKIQIVMTSTDKKIYVYNPATKRAGSYVEGIGGVGGYKPVSLGSYNTVVSLLKKRLAAKAEAANRERERIAAWKKAHGEDKTQVGTVNANAMDEMRINAPATSAAVRLDAEREDSKFDGRTAERDCIFSRTEAESYEETDSLLDDDKVDLTGYHKATLIRWESIKGRVEVAKDGSQKFYKAYIRLTFCVDGMEVESRAYSKDWESFKMQANKKHHGLFNYMGDSKALDSLKGKEFDIWLHWNELFYNQNTKTQGEWQAAYYDKAAYAAYKAQRNQVGFVRSGYGRPTENKAAC